MTLACAVLSMVFVMPLIIGLNGEQVSIYNLVVAVVCWLLAVYDMCKGGR